jgi:hypothetical protein
MNAKSHALIALGENLRSRGYHFVAVTPATHCRVLDRPATTSTLESIFGWNRPFDRADVDNDIFELLEDAEALEGESGRHKSRVRFATIGELLFVHSGFPTAEQDAVFFGPILIGSCGYCASLLPMSLRASPSGSLISVAVVALEGYSQPASFADALSFFSQT